MNSRMARKYPVSSRRSRILYVLSRTFINESMNQTESVLGDDLPSDGEAGVQVCQHSLVVDYTCEATISYEASVQ